MESPLPSNQELVDFSTAVDWNKLEQIKERFNATVRYIATTPANDVTFHDRLSLEALSEAIGAPVTTYYDLNQPQTANVFLAEINGRKAILGSVVSNRYRGGKTLAQSIVPYNLNPAVNHTNIEKTDDAQTSIRAMGAELELGLLHRDGTPPTSEEVNTFIDIYRHHARRLGITRQVDREACKYQIEVHVAPGVGYHRTRKALDSIMIALVASGEATNLQTAILSSYPIESDFSLSPDPKVQSAVDLMVDINSQFPAYQENLRNFKERYHIDPAANCVESFRMQGCHIHLDLAGRSEALGLLSFHTALRSATAVANSAVLKGGPFVNGTCDAKLLCARELTRTISVTGRTIEAPISPHLRESDLERYAGLLYSERANGSARALLYDDSLGQPISAMHSLVGRVRSDLVSKHRICTLESTGMPVNVSASRQAAVLTDFEFTHALMEAYFRKYGLDLEPLYEDKDLLAIAGPLPPETFAEMHHRSDRECTDIVLKTAAGTEMSLVEFYDMKRRYMHKHLTESAHIAPRDINGVYASLQRMLAPASGKSAQTVEQYISDYKLRSTGNWGRILRDAFIEEGGTPGDHNPEAVLRVTNRIHDALKAWYN